MMFFKFFFFELYILHTKDRTPPCPVWVCGIGVEEKWIVASLLIIEFRIISLPYHRL
jgi:hypothetical protein